jgi:hypothetical protein
MLNNDLHPMQRFDFDKEGAPQISSFVDELPLETIAALIHPEPNHINSYDLKQAFCAALEAYTDGALHRMNQKSEGEDNRALDAITSKAQELYSALLAAMDHPALIGQVQKDLGNIRTLHHLPDSNTLSDLVGNDGRSFGHLCELLVDLQVGTEAAILRKPKLRIIEGMDGEADMRLDTDEELAEKMREYRRRSVDRRIPNDYALQRFLMSIKGYWLQASPYPFTEGMHHRDQGQTASNAVDVMELVLRLFDGEVTRQKIVTAFRKGP